MTFADGFFLVSIRTGKQLDAAYREESVISDFLLGILGAKGVSLIASHHGIHAHTPVVRVSHLLIQLQVLRDDAGVVHAHEA